jgi:hypothetical protein
MAVFALLAASGCQTFTMSDEKFSQEQQGHYDENLGSCAVESGGTLLNFFAPASWRPPGQR